VFCVPIFITTIFDDKKMTRLIHCLSYVFLFLSGVIASTEFRCNDSTLVFDCIVAGVIQMCSYIASIVLLQYHEERTDIIRAGYLIQLQMGEQLKHDLLTGLYNYNAFLEILSHITSQKNLQDTNLQLAIIDLDNFKIVNDTYGHEQGNEVLIYLSELLKKHTSKIGYTARYGGEEFIILFVKSSLQEAYEIVENIRTEFSGHNFDFCSDIKITFSCGLAESSIEKPSKMFLDLADEAMYVAKRTGKNKTIISGREADQMSASNHHNNFRPG
jgi:diguanylate cyclase (GGDEF)-like protein